MTNQTIDGLLRTELEVICENFESGRHWQAVQGAHKLRALLTAPSCDTLTGAVCPGDGVQPCRKCPSAPVTAQIHDGDSLHTRGSLCEECAAWDILRKYAATDNAVPEAPAPAAPEQPVNVYTRPVDLLCHLMLLPASADNPKEAVLDLGIRWEKYWGNPVTGEIRLLGCTNVPVDLPKWLEVAQ